MTFTITLQLRASGDTPEAILKAVRERLQGSGDVVWAQLEQITIKPATKRGGDK